MLSCVSRLLDLSAKMLVICCAVSGKDTSNDNDLEKYVIASKWAELLRTGENDVGAYDTGKLKKRDHTPIEAFIPVDPHMYYSDNVKCGKEKHRRKEVVCDPYGKKPCCSPFGWCGNTNDFCTCLTTVSEKGDELGPCRDFRDDPSVIIKKQGYESYYKSGENPLPITLLWKFPDTITVSSFAFAVPSDQLDSAPLKYSLVGSSDPECHNVSRDIKWFTLFDTLETAVGVESYQGNLETISRDSFCVGFKIEKTKNGKAALTQIEMRYVNWTAAKKPHHGHGHVKEYRIIKPKKKKKEDVPTGCRGFCFAMIFLGVGLAVMAILGVLLATGQFRKDATGQLGNDVNVNLNRGRKYRTVYGFYTTDDEKELSWSDSIN